MRQAVPSAGQPTSGSDSRPAPTGGWNARDPVANMPSDQALFLDNWFPRTSDVLLRPGSALFATTPVDLEPATPNNIRSLLSYKSPTGTAKLFAGANTGIYDVTAGGAIAAVASACTNGEWISSNISTAGGNFLWCCNSVDKSRYFNGSAWTVLDGTSTPALTGIVSADIANSCLFKSRLMFCVKNSLSFWYLPVNSVAGAALEFPLGALFQRGGYLAAVGTWTIDGGNGPDDYFVAVTSEGEIAVYAGTDPSSASSWGLKGVYFVGKPIGRRCLLRLGGDLCLLTVQGIYPLSKSLLSATIDRTTSVSDRISRVWSDFSAAYKDLYGWQPILFPEATMLLVNVPVLTNHPLNAVYSYQFVMNTQTKAWCRFTGMPAEAWGTFEGNLYFALHNKVYQAWTGTEDVGKPIDARAKTAFFYPAGRGHNAHVKLLRPTFTASAALRVQVGIDTDYDESSLNGTQISYAQAVAKWDVAKWNEVYWSSGNSTVARWKTVGHSPGRAIAVRLRILSKGVTITWIATDLILQKGSMF